MKKFFKVVLTVLTLAIVTSASIGCRKPETLTYTDPAKVISARVNGEFIRQLSLDIKYRMCYDGAIKYKG